MKGLNLVAVILLVIGGLNWLLVGLFEWDLVGGLFGGMDSVMAKIVYILVGVAAIYSLKLLPKLSN
jgi:uncharacterized protein